MRNEVVQTVFFLFVLVLAAAAQDLLPSWGGVKPPLLAAVAVYLAVTRRAPAAILGALAAGGFGDALSGLPGFCTAGFLLVVYLFARAFRRTADLGAPSALLGALLLACAAPCGEVWTWIWTGRPWAGPVAGHLFLAAVAGFAAGLVVFLLVGWTEGLAGARAEPDEEEAR